jgi:beta-lactamase superfamily II metal-dependent hydrolase
MDTLRVRVYNVRFGDAILISVPDLGPGGETTLRHILIDVGNSFSKEGGLNDVFAPVVEDILTELDGKGLDLYVMSHEHMDHVEGLQYVDDTIYHGTLKDKLGIRHAWFTASSAPDYYDRPEHKKAKEKHEQAKKALKSIASYLAAVPPDDLPEGMETLLGINSLAGTNQCVEYLQNLAPQDCTHYVYHEVDLTGLHNFQEARFDIWAPEEDTSVYYGRFQPMALNFLPAVQVRGSNKPRKGTIIDPVPPPGVDASAFYHLVERRKSGVTENLMAIDKAANNTSVVFSLEWRGWKLLFAADAELRSWQTMKKLGLLKPVDFLKVGHHGSQNATPPPEILHEILPVNPDREHKAVVSTFYGKDPGHYPGVPDPDTLDRVKACWTLYDTRDVDFGKYIDILFEGKPA